ncbi:GNAT family N-acetyltransferase [Allonocardiopsis opalescens]|uniref:GNAT family N-acetyltransferase n=1 Tax=Allonocardiopsis opalescens TaxID=1144618 RepID=UPI000D066688|nr:GNAT family N-acetyltransferase [Allonocardiopsis opalescens]
MLRTSPVRVLAEDDLDRVLDILDQDPIANVFVASRVRAAGLDPHRLGGEVWGFLKGDRLVSLCYAGANLIPIQATPDAVRLFAEHARWRGRRCSSIVGDVRAVAPMWELLRPYWGPARAVRGRQPVLAISAAPAVTADPRVRRVRPTELPVLLPACVAMFTEEVGVAPDSGGDGGALYRARVEELIRKGRSFARFDDGDVTFKAEIGAVTPQACQVQGVWVRPEQRGRRHSVHGMAAVVAAAQTSIAPVVTLYVNDYNTAARATYRRVGFTEVGTFMSVLF